MMSSVESGLSGVEAARRLAAYGPNEPVPVRRLSALVQLLQLFANPLVIILLVASAIAASLRQHVDALIIFTMVVLGVGINFWQSYRSQQAGERLRGCVNPTDGASRWRGWPYRCATSCRPREEPTRRGAASLRAAALYGGGTRGHAHAALSDATCDWIVVDRFCRPGSDSGDGSASP